MKPFDSMNYIIGNVEAKFTVYRKFSNKSAVKETLISRCTTATTCDSDIG